ncbi:hypothetical protein BH23VER1_BH23VER1_26340 [soil metagenome]
MNAPLSDFPAGSRWFHGAILAMVVSVLALPSLSASSWKKVGNAWSRIVEHADGTRTFSKQDIRTKTLEEATYSEGDVLIKRRLFQLDDLGNPRLAMLFDGRSNLLARTEYIYDEYGDLKEEVLFNTRGQLLRRLLYGLSAGIDERPVAFTYDPNNPDGTPVETRNAEAVMPSALAPGTGARGAAIPSGRALPSAGRATRPKRGR